MRSPRMLHGSPPTGAPLLARTSLTAMYTGGIDAEGRMLMLLDFGWRVVLLISHNMAQRFELADRIPVRGWGGA